MPYARAWSKTTPPGSQAANTADDELRNLREDVEDRMADLVTGWSTTSPTDPVVPLAVIKGNVTGKSIFLHPSSFVSSPATLAYNDAFVQAVEPTAIAYAPLVLPVGVTIKAVSFNVLRAPGTITLTLFHEAWGPVSPGDLVTVATASDSLTSGIFLLELLSLTHITVANKGYFIKITFTAGSRIYVGKIIYDTPDCRVTL